MGGKQFFEMFDISTTYDSVQLLGFGLFGNLTLIHSLYVISVRQARVLPPASFNLLATEDALALDYILPIAGRIRDLHPLDRAPTSRTATSSRTECSAAVLFVAYLSFRGYNQSRNANTGVILCLKS